MYDANGTDLAIYTQSGSATPVETEVPFYGTGRLGTYFVAGNNYVYELRDNVGSVRVAINGTKVSGQADIYTYDDYYPYGSVARSGGQNYRYDYQGAYAEKDPVTGYNNFELRMYDARIGRWLSTDPAGQYASPYEGMGNNPVTRNDPTGGVSPIYDNITGEFLGTDSEGFTGDILYGNKDLYNTLSNNGKNIIDHNLAEGAFIKPTFNNIMTESNPFGGITLQALGNSYADILNRSGFNTSNLLNNTIGINYNDYNKGLAGSFNNAISGSYSYTAASTRIDSQTGKINVTAEWTTVASGNTYVIGSNGKQQETSLFTTVENVQNGLGVHELLNHGILGLSNDDHPKIFQNQMNDKSWLLTTPAFKNYIYDLLRH